MRNKFASESYLKVKQTILSGRPNQMETVKNLVDLFIISNATEQEKSEIVELFKTTYNDNDKRENTLEKGV